MLDSSLGSKPRSEFSNISPGVRPGGGARHVPTAGEETVVSGVGANAVKPTSVTTSREIGGTRDGPRIAVLVPCHNEEATVGDVVREFSQLLPDSNIFVYDNASTDATTPCALDAGATVYFEPRRGKGNVLRRMFADIEADVYVMIDGDGTYDVSRAPEMVTKLLAQHLDMVIATRVPDASDDALFRRGHTAGNAFFTWAIRHSFGGQFTDVLSGYRVMSRRFVKSLPVFSSGFEIETELNAHAERVRASVLEIPTRYRSRADGSPSKLRTIRDGLHILKTILRLIEEMRPLLFFGSIFVALTAGALALGIPILDEFARTGRVPAFPSAILAGSIQVVAFLALAAGVILRSVARVRDEVRQMMYLQLPAPTLEVRYRGSEIPKVGASSSIVTRQDK